MNDELTQPIDPFMFHPDELVILAIVIAINVGFLVFLWRRWER